MKKKFHISLNRLNATTAFTSAGVCFYTDHKILLLRKQNNNYEFLGGKTDNRDTSLFITAMRESHEESNCLILGYKENNIENIIKYVKKTNKGYVYWYPNKEYRFGLFFIRLENTMEKESPFYGSKEIHENIERSLEWISINNTDILNNVKININYENDCFILDNISDIIDNPESCDFLHKWYL
tara:strand:+ start:795 stop:1346 length:552 start_codon:yes stop_codon:yes gene_type:complete